MFDHNFSAIFRLLEYIQLTKSSRAKHGGAYFSAVCEWKSIPISAPEAHLREAVPKLFAVYLSQILRCRFSYTLRPYLLVHSSFLLQVNMGICTAEICFTSQGLTVCSLSEQAFKLMSCNISSSKSRNILSIRNIHNVVKAHRILSN